MTLAGGGRRIFPVSLYASLLVALLCLVRPDALRVFESHALAVQCLPFRALPGTHDAQAASRMPVAAPRVSMLGDRLAVFATRRPPGVDPMGVPVLVRVVERRGRSSASRPDELVLDLPRDALTSTEVVATWGDALVGFARGDAEPDAGDALGRFATVELLNHTPERRPPRRVAAGVTTADGELRFLVEPAARINAWPLRCTLLSDPYLAAGIVTPDLRVRTSEREHDPMGPVPEGLEIGELRILGYRRSGGRKSVTIGLFVEPVRSPAELNYVALWLPERSAHELRGRGDVWTGAVRHDVRLVRVPGAAAGGDRWLCLTDGASLPVGGALVEGLRILGTLERGGAGYGVVAPFARAGRRWSLVFVPEDPDAPPIDLVATVERDAGGGLVELRVHGEVAPARGDLFCGCGGRHQPAGLWVGRAVIETSGTLHVAAGDVAGAVRPRVFELEPGRDGP